MTEMTLVLLDRICEQFWGMKIEQTVKSTVDVVYVQKRKIITVRIFIVLFSN